MTIFYEFEGKLYANITNKCPCSCIFIHIKRLQRNGNGENIKIRLPYFRRRKSVYRRKRLILTEVQNGTE